MDVIKPTLASDGSLILRKGTNKEGLTKWEPTIVGDFVDIRLPFKVVSQCAHAMWDRKGLKEACGNGDGLFLFVFKNKISINEVLNGGPWFMLRQPIIL